MTLCWLGTGNFGFSLALLIDMATAQMNLSSSNMELTPLAIVKPNQPVLDSQTADLNQLLSTLEGEFSCVVSTNLCDEQACSC